MDEMRSSMKDSLSGEEVKGTALITWRAIEGKTLVKAFKTAPTNVPSLSCRLWRNKEKEES
jgi:hypothetical protein